MENLSDLNTGLFKLVKEAIDGKVEPQKVKSVVNISNTIINSQKLQLDALKFSAKLGKEKKPGESFGIEAAKEQLQIEQPKKEDLSKLDAHQQSNAFAKSLGCENVAEAIKKFPGVYEFNKAKKRWLEENE